MLRRVAPAAAFAGLILFALTAHLLAETKTVEKPMFNGHRLAWCANWGADCGEPAAEAWCIAQGFAGVETFTKAPGIGDKAPTRLIATGAICDDAGCDGFKEITCVKLDTVQPRPKAGTAAVAIEEPAETTASLEAKADDAAPATAETEPPLPAPAEPQTVADTSLEPEAAPAPEATGKVDAKPAVRVIPPEDPPAVTESPAMEPAAGAQPVAAEAIQLVVDAAVEEPDDETGPPPPDTWLLAAAGAPPIKPVIEIFKAPVFEGRRLDWCRGWKDRCGKAAADEFCQRNGFIEAASFEPDPKIGATEPTRQIASGLVCDHDGCDGFAEIACRK